MNTGFSPVGNGHISIKRSGVSIVTRNSRAILCAFMKKAGRHGWNVELRTAMAHLQIGRMNRGGVGQKNATPVKSKSRKRLSEQKRSGSPEPWCCFTANLHMAHGLI